MSEQDAPATGSGSRARIETSELVSVSTEDFACRLDGWEPYGGAWSFGAAEMDSWRLTLSHDTHAAAAAGRPCWVLTDPGPGSGGGTGAAGDPMTARARRYRGGPLEETETLGLLVLDDTGNLWASTDLYPDWTASSDSGFSDLEADSEWPLVTALGL